MKNKISLQQYNDITVIEHAHVQYSNGLYAMVILTKRNYIDSSSRSNELLAFSIQSEGGEVYLQGPRVGWECFNEVRRPTYLGWWRFPNFHNKYNKDCKPDT